MKELSDRTWLAIILTIICYLFIVVISDISIRVLNLHDDFLLNTLISLGFLLLLLFGLKSVFRIPSGKQSIIKYFYSIKLLPISNWRSILIYSLGIYLLFSIMQILGSLIYHFFIGEPYTINLHFHSFDNVDTIFIALFEEIVWRGIVLTLLLKKYPVKEAVIYSALLFGGIHLLNILNSSHEVEWVFAQAFWAIGFGYLYAMLVVRLKSIVPGILIHYLINASVGIWFTGLTEGDLNSALFGIFFFGWIPVILCMVILRSSLKLNNKLS